MTTLGWIFMSVSLIAVWGGAFWCYRKVLQTPQEEKVPVGFGP
jgi:hypothetical protein